MTRPSIFICYSHADEAWKDLLVSQLTVLGSEVDVWHDRRISAGEPWKTEIESALRRAGAAVLLISADFLTSSFILETEVPVILRRHLADGMLMLPLIVRPCPWRQIEWLESVNCRPQDGKPLAKKRKAEREQLVSNFAEEIAQLISNRQALNDRIVTESANASESARKSADESYCRYDFFISYASPDARYALQLSDELSKTFRVFIDGGDANKKETDGTVISLAQNESRATVALLSSATHHSSFQQKEIAQSISLSSRATHGHVLIPLHIDEGELRQLPFGIDRRKIISCRRSAGIKMAASALGLMLKTEPNKRPDGLQRNVGLGPARIYPGHFGVTFGNPDYSPSELIGRGDLLQEVMEFLSGNIRVVAIDGLGGVGKTSLAASAYLLAKQRNIFEGGTWITCQGGGSNFATFLRQVATNTNAPVIEDFDESHRVQQVLRHLSLVSTLMVVDSIDRMSASQQEKFILFAQAVPPASKVILVSRGRLDISGATHRRVGPLDIESSIDLIERRVAELGWSSDTTPPRSDWAPLVKALEGSPWFILSAIAHIDQTGLSLDRMVKRLKGMHPRKDFVHLFGDIFEALSSDQKTVLFSLALSVRPMSREALLWIANLEEARLGHAIHELYKSGLLDRYGSALSQRYHVHQLTKYYIDAQQNEPMDERGCVEDRYIEFYCQLAEQNGGPLNNWARYEQLDVEIDNVLHAFALARRRSETDQSLSEHAVRFGMALSFYFELRGRWEERISYCNHALSAALATGRHLEAGWMNLALGWTHAKQGKITVARERSQRAMRLLTEVNDGRGIAYATRLFAIVAFEAGDYVTAHETHVKAVDQIRPYGDHDLAIFLNSLAKVQRAQRMLDESYATLMEVLRIAELIKEPERIAGARRDLARICLLRNQTADARDHLRIGLEAAQRVGRTSSIADCLNGMALCCEANEAGIATRYLAEAESLYTGLGVSPQRDFLDCSMDN
jgi:tetratricopeptide (TPR) repeat protein